MNISLNVDQLRHDIEALLRDYPDLADDEILRADMLDGATDLNNVMMALFDVADTNRALISAVSERIKQMGERRSRFTRRVEFLRGLMLKVLQSADLKKLELPAATLSQRNGQPQLIGDCDVNDLPDDLKRITAEPDRVKIREALMMKRDVPGYVLSNAAPTLAINVK